MVVNAISIARAVLPGNTFRKEMEWRRLSLVKI
jgi:hypothetical protein